MTDELEHKAVEIITQLQHLAPRASELALTVARVDAARFAVVDVICGMAAVAIIIFWRRTYWPWVKRGLFDELAYFIAGGALVIAGGICALQCIFGLTDPWLYAAFFHPELWLAHKIMG